ncbi:hypothetical protein ACLOJK_034716 [Asimina triloba]
MESPSHEEHRPSMNGNRPNRRQQPHQANPSVGDLRSASPLPSGRQRSSPSQQTDSIQAAASRDPPIQPFHGAQSTGNNIWPATHLYSPSRGHRAARQQLQLHPTSSPNQHVRPVMAVTRNRTVISERLADANQRMQFGQTQITARIGGPPGQRTAM